jgi:hypothetical protein
MKAVGLSNPHFVLQERQNVGDFGPQLKITVTLSVCLKHGPDWGTVSLSEAWSGL